MTSITTRSRTEFFSCFVLPTGKELLAIEKQFSYVRQSGRVPLLLFSPPPPLEQDFGGTQARAPAGRTDVLSVELFLLQVILRCFPAVWHVSEIGKSRNPEPLFPHEQTGETFSRVGRRLETRSDGKWSQNVGVRAFQKI